MWILSTIGMFSIVLKGRECLVRARVRDHLEAMIALGRQKRVAGAKRWAIVEWPTADYRWRVHLPKAAAVEIIGHLAQAIDYPNFKGECAAKVRRRKLDAPYERALHEVWTVMGRLQPGGPYGWNTQSNVRDDARGLDVPWPDFKGEWPAIDDRQQPLALPKKTHPTPGEVATVLVDSIDDPRFTRNGNCVTYTEPPTGTDVVVGGARGGGKSERRNLAIEAIKQAGHDVVAVTSATAERFRLEPDRGLKPFADYVARQRALHAEAFGQLADGTATLELTNPDGPTMRVVSTRLKGGME